MAEESGWFELKYHADYKKQERTWIAHRDFADGSHDLVATRAYVPPYKTDLQPKFESEATYANRLARTVNINITAPILDEHTHASGREITVQNFDDDVHQDILEDPAQNGENVRVAFRRALSKYYRDGCLGILVERGKDPNPAIRSFQVMYETLTIRDWEYFSEGPRRGQLRMVLLQDANVVRDKRIYHRARRYELTDESLNYIWKIYESEPKDPGLKLFEEPRYKLIEEGEGEFGEIPFVLMGRGIKDSAVKDVVPLNIGILNRNSILSNINYHQGFRVPVFTGVGDLNEIGPVSEYNAVALSNPTAGVTTIDAGDPVAIEKERNFLIHWAKRVGMKQFKQLLDDMTKQVQSAESKAQDLIALKEFYNETLDFFEGWLSAVYRLHAKFENVNISDDALQAIKVSISRDFELEDKEAQLQEDTVVRLMVDSLDEETRLEIIKAILKRYISGMEFIPSESMTEDEERMRYLELIENATLAERRQIATPSFSGVLRNRFAIDENNLEDTTEQQ